MNFDYKKYLINPKAKSNSFSSFMENLIERPKSFLYTSPSLIADAIRSFGYEIVVRSGEPVVNYAIFSDPFSNGVNAIYGQEFCIDKILDIIDSADQESIPRRGNILVGPPSSGKTNIIDMMTRGLEEYTRKENVEVCTFFVVFRKGDKKFVFKSPFLHNPILLIPITSEKDGKIIYPRKEFFAELEKNNSGLIIPNYYKNATLDKVTLDILDHIIENSKDSYSEMLNKHIMVERTNFSIAQGIGIANIDDMSKLKVNTKKMNVGSFFKDILDSFIPGMDMHTYSGSLVSSNRGILHIHDAFSEVNSEDKYRPLLMLLGSGKVSIDSTQTFLDTTVFITTNLDEMHSLEKELTSKKLLDRVEKIPINYLVDANSEMEILERDMVGIKDKYDIDPNLIRIASYYSVMTRLFPTLKSNEDLPVNWEEDKKDFYRTIPPEKKLFIYCSQCKDPVKTIMSLPPLHQFRNECFKLGIDLSDPDSFKEKVVKNKRAMSLEETGIFSNNEIKMIDDEFMRLMIREHYMSEGKYGMSVRQLQNIMRDTIASSDGRKITVNQFIKQLSKIVAEGSNTHYWLNDGYINDLCDDLILKDRFIGHKIFGMYDGMYGDYLEIVDIIEAIYNSIISKEITIAVVNRDREKTENDLRKYIQHVLLYRASNNKSFSKVLVDQYSFIDPISGARVDSCNGKFMTSIESVLCIEMLTTKQRESFRNMIADKFFKSKDSGDLDINDGHSIMNSENDNLIFCFSQEYSVLLAHGRVMDGINIQSLEEAFYYKYNSKNKYEKCEKKIIEVVEMILDNLENNNGYSRDMALETVTYALTEHIIEFEEILS